MADHPLKRIDVVSRWMGATAILALLALAVTLVLQQVRGETEELGLAAAQERAVRGALAFAKSDFASLQAGLQEVAQSVALNPSLIQDLASLEEDEQTSVDGLVRSLAAQDFPPLVSVEVYDPTPRLRAWNGDAMPMDDAPASPGFLADPQFRIARDGQQRVAVVLWHPIRENGRSVGAVRVMRLVLVRVPVRNEYLEDESLESDWSRKTGLTVSIEFGSESGEAGDRFFDQDGSPLLSVSAQGPSRVALNKQIRQKYSDISAFWLLIAVSLAGFLGLRQIAQRNLAFFRKVALTVAVLVPWRFFLLHMRIPARWQEGKAPFSPLFDPAHLASDVGFGLFQTTGDLVLTALFCLALGIGAIRCAALGREGARPEPLLAGAIFGTVSGAFFAGFALVVRALLLDSTLDYFARSGLLPQRLVAVVFASLLVLVLAGAFVSIAVGRVVLPVRKEGYRAAALGTFIAALGTAFVSGFLLPQIGVAQQVSLVAFAVGGFVAVLVLPKDRLWPPSALYLRSILLVVVLLAVVLYPVLDNGIESKERLRMEDAVRSFSEEQDPRALLAVSQVLRSVREELDADEGITFDPPRVDSLLEAELRGSLLSSLGTYEVSVAVLDEVGNLIGRNTATRTAAALARALHQDRVDLALLREIRFDRGEAGPVIEKITSPVELDRFDYIGIEDSRDGTWILVRASQSEHLPSGNTPFPRVLVPAGYYGSLYPDLSIAEFRDGVRVRSFGSAFGRSFLDSEAAAVLENRESVLREEDIRDRSYTTLYVRASAGQIWSGSEPSFGRATIGVRRSSVNLFDRLYFLLRLTVPGLFLGLLVYAAGLWIRWRMGELPARRSRFRDKVLNAFFAVGLIVVVAMGWVGLRVVTEETDHAVESWLRQHLDRVEDALALRAGSDEMPYRVLERLDVDSLAAQVGLDLNIYLGVELEATSRPQLVRDRLISRRLPIAAYNALFVSGFRFASVDEHLGSFAYTAGYRALPDEQGVPRYVVSVPTLPEQERIEEERARTAAYLFGALLLLMIVVMVTAAVIANALSRPIKALQRGLQTAAEGRFERIGSLKTRDEIGELVGTFNSMQDQLGESRRLLAQQERQLAWREMARQVAHEIKNPLTPMRLSIQHLRRAYTPEEGESKFRSLLDQISTTLIEQIDTLVRIANEFSSFARMPLQHLEEMDLNEVILEAVALMQEHASPIITINLHDKPLPVEVDREGMRRLYINFIKNALESLETDRPGRITVTSGHEIDPDTGNTWAVSAVADNGSGVPEELQDRIFNPSFSTKTSGTGLGLAISKNTIEEIGGRIGFETDPGVGSMFWARIPLVIREDEED